MQSEVRLDLVSFPRHTVMVPVSRRNAIAYLRDRVLRWRGVPLLLSEQ